MAKSKEKQNENPVAEGERATRRATSESRNVFGTFRDRESAERACRSLSQRGYGQDDVNLIMSDETRRKYFAEDEDDQSHLSSKALEGAGGGAAIGGTAVGVLSAIAAAGTTIALPGMGLVLAGPLVAGLVGAGAGGIAGGLIGALIGWGLPEESARKYEKDIRDGGIVMGVAPKSTDDADFVRKEWQRFDGRNIGR